MIGRRLQAFRAWVHCDWLMRQERLIIARVITEGCGRKMVMII